MLQSKCDFKTVAFGTHGRAKHKLFWIAVPVQHQFLHKTKRQKNKKDKQRKKTPTNLARPEHILNHSFFRHSSQASTAAAKQANTRLFRRTGAKDNESVCFCFPSADILTRLFNYLAYRTIMPNPSWTCSVDMSQTLRSLFALLSIHIFKPKSTSRNERGSL